MVVVMCVYYFFSFSVKCERHFLLGPLSEKVYLGFSRIDCFVTPSPASSSFQLLCKGLGERAVGERGVSKCV